VLSYDFIVKIYFRLW